MGFLGKVVNRFVDAHPITKIGRSDVFADAKEFVDDLGGKFVEGALNPRSPNLVFPPDTQIFQRPYVRFGCHSADATDVLKHICLPCPPGIQFTDSAEYTSISMGKIAAVADITRAGMEGYKSGGAAGAAMGALGNAKDQLMSAGAIGAGILAARAIGADDLAQGLEFGSKMTINPRMNTAFTGNTLRTFSFSFKLIGSSKQEVDTIRQIQRYFQEQVYAAELGGEKVMLKYPNQWRIEFMDPNGSELTHVPKIYTSYLTSCSTHINATGATFRKDMSPYEVDVSLSFQETKVLTRDELNSLNNWGDRTNKDTANLKKQTDEIKGIITDVYEKHKADKAAKNLANFADEQGASDKLPGQRDSLTDTISGKPLYRPNSDFDRARRRVDFFTAD